AGAGYLLGAAVPSNPADVMPPLVLDPANLFAAGPAAAPWLAELLTPSGVDTANPLLALRQFFSGAEPGDYTSAAMLTRLLRSPWVPGAVVTLVALELFRRHARA